MRDLRLIHHTKDKGDKGVGHVIATLMENNIKVALPISEHLPFDLIAISNEGVLRRISVKYRHIDRTKANAGCVCVRGRGRGVTHGSVDAYAIYCPETRRCYFVRDEDIKNHNLVLRVVKQEYVTRRARMAEDYEDPMIIFGSSN